MNDLSAWRLKTNMHCKITTHVNRETENSSVIIHIYIHHRESPHVINGFVLKWTCAKTTHSLNH